MLHSPTVDRRVLRTRKLLGDALIALAIEKGYSQVTIQDVTDRADIGYRTFFRHFASTDELLLSVAKTVLDELETLIGVPSPEEAMRETKEESAERARILFQYVQDHEIIFRVLLLERGSSHFLKPMLAHAYQSVRQQVFAGTEALPLKLDLMVHHIVSASLSMLRWWLQNDMPYPPATMGVHMAEIISVPSRKTMIEVIASEFATTLGPNTAP